MKNMIKNTTLAIVFGLAALASGPVGAAETARAPMKQSWSFDGAFGSYDKAELQRGFQIYKDVCAACHSMRLVAFRTLGDLGFSEAEVKALAAAYEVEDGPNDDGEMYNRPARPSDRFPSPFANIQEARLANNGAAPPDLSLMAKARMGGPDYIYSLLVGYEDAPAHVELATGMYYNPYFPGGQIAMAPPLSDDMVEYADGTPATTAQMAHDLSSFLMWAAEPKLEDRKSLGFRVMIFLVILSVLLYFVNRKVWAPVKRGEQV